MAQEFNPYLPSGSSQFQGGLQRSLVTQLGCSSLPNSTHRACSLGVQRQRICSPCAGSVLFPRGCKTQRVSSKVPARTSCSGRDHRPQTPSGALPSAALHTKFSRDIPLLTRTPGKRDSSGHCKERINEPRAHKGTEGKELKLGLHLTHLLHVKLQDDTHDNQVHV